MRHSRIDGVRMRGRNTKLVNKLEGLQLYFTTFMKLYFIFLSIFSVRQPPKRMLPPSIPISQPVRSPKFGVLPSPCTSHVHAKYDVLVWFEICELGELWYDQICILSQCECHDQILVTFINNRI